ncbi:hypothetical protein COCC4DRAFT_30384, partial [Bipolaris maydis ATCC 48331]
MFMYIHTDYPDASCRVSRSHANSIIYSLITRNEARRRKKKIRQDNRCPFPQKCAQM